MEIEDEIRNKILEDINAKKIILLDMGPIYLIVIVWNSEMSNFEKRIHIRRLLKFVNVSFDIIVLTSDEFDKEIQNNDFFIVEAIINGKVLHSDDDEYIAV